MKLNQLAHCTHAQSAKSPGRGGGEGIPRISWWGFSFRFFKFRHYFGPKHAIFYNGFQTWLVKVVLDLLPPNLAHNKVNII